MGLDGQFDVVVVGARCAGAPLATMLARAGVRVCLVDKDGFPSDTLSTHAIQPAGVQVLERIGVLDSLLKLAPPMLRARMVFDDAAVFVEDVVAITGAPVLSVRRTALDEILVGAAAEAGADVRTKTPVTGLVVDHGRVAGVVTSAGELRAPLVVGADGTRSAVARMVGAREYCRPPNGRLFMWAYYEADPTNGEMWLGKLDDHAYLVTPTDNGLTLIGACPSIDRRGDARANRDRVYEAGVRGWPGCKQASPERGGLALFTQWPTCTASSASRPGLAGCWWEMPAISKTPHPDRGSPMRFASPKRWRPQSSVRLMVATVPRTTSCARGGAGAIRTRGRCTGWPTIWARPGRRPRCSARCNDGLLPIAT